MHQDSSIYVVGPDEAISLALSTLVGRYSISVETFLNAEDFLSVVPALDEQRTTLLIAAELPGLSGLALLKQLRAQGLSAPVIVLLEAACSDTRQEALQLGATAVIEKQLAIAFLAARFAQLFPGLKALPGAKTTVTLRNKQRATFRMMSPDDAALEQAFVQRLSPNSRYMRFFSLIKQLSPEMLEQFTNPEYPRTYALIATVSNAGQEQQIGEARFEPYGTSRVVEFAVVVADEWQGVGLGGRLMHGLIATAAVAGVRRLEGQVLRKNFGMLKLMEALRFSFSPLDDDPTIVRAIKDLRGDGDTPPAPLSADHNP